MNCLVFEIKLTQQIKYIFWVYADSEGMKNAVKNKFNPLVVLEIVMMKLNMLDAEEYRLEGVECMASSFALSKYNYTQLDLIKNSDADGSESRKAPSDDLLHPRNLSIVKKLVEFFSTFLRTPPRPPQSILVKRQHNFSTGHAEKHTLTSLLHDWNFQLIV